MPNTNVPMILKGCVPYSRSTSLRSNVFRVIRSVFVYTTDTRHVYYKERSCKCLSCHLFDMLFLSQLHVSLYNFEECTKFCLLQFKCHSYVILSGYLIIDRHLFLCVHVKF